MRAVKHEINFKWPKLVNPQMFPLAITWVINADPLLIKLGYKLKSFFKRKPEMVLTSIAFLQKRHHKAPVPYIDREGQTGQSFKLVKTIPVLSITFHHWDS